MREESIYKIGQTVIYGGKEVIVKSIKYIRYTGKWMINVHNERNGFIGFVSENELKPNA